MVIPIHWMIFWAERDVFIQHQATNFLIECILESRDALD